MPEIIVTRRDGATSTLTVNTGITLMEALRDLPCLYRPGIRR
jgi:hypothetical protein